MRISEIMQLSIDIVKTYYQNNLRLFFAHLDENILWYGPAKGQFLSGRKAVIEAWKQENNSLTFTLGNIRTECASTHPSFCEMMISFPVATNFPNGESILVDQIIHITWCERKIENVQEKQPRMLVIHISNLYHQHEADKIYPVHFNEVYQGYVPIAASGSRIHLRSIDRADHYLLSDTIQWIESTNAGRHALIHTGDEAIEVTATVQAIENTWPNLFLRCHSSYLVNLRHVRQIKRFEVVMADGSRLPIPEKKYTAVKAKLTEYWENTFSSHHS